MKFKKKYHAPFSETYDILKELLKGKTKILEVGPGRMLNPLHFIKNILLMIGLVIFVFLWMILFLFLLIYDVIFGGWK